jgi:cell division septation protein DedD
MALTPSAEPTVAAAATPEATADTVEKTAAVEPKKPARKRVAAPKPQPSFFDFFSGGFNNNGRANNARSNTARSTGPRSFF